MSRGESAPPEGRWSWIVTLGMTTVLVSTTTHVSCFGLIFRDLLYKFRCYTTGATIIMNVLAATIIFTGLVSVNLLKNKSHRILCVFGSLIHTIGVMLTMFANSTIYIIVSYSIISGIGLGLLIISSYLTFESYFTHNRNVALGLCQGFVGVGYMIAPPVVEVLMNKYGFRGTMLLLGGISLHSLLGGILYRPLKLRTVSKKSYPDDGLEEIPLDVQRKSREGLNLPEVGEEEEDGLQLDSLQSRNTRYSVQYTAKGSEGSSVQSQADNASHVFILSGNTDSRRSSTASAYNLQRHPSPHQTESVISFNYLTNTIMFDNVYNIITKTQNVESEQPVKSVRMRSNKQKRTNRLSIGGMSNSSKRWSRLYNDDGTEVLAPHSSTQNILEADQKRNDLSPTQKWIKFKRNFYKLSEFNYLADIKLLNVIFGLSVSFISDVNFFIILPFYLLSEPVSLSGQQTAMCLSITVAMDTITRLILPRITVFFEMDTRWGFTIACLLSALVRTVLAACADLISLSILLAVIGVLKGMMFVNSSTTLLQQITQEKKSSVYNFYMFVTAVIIIITGPFVGIIIDKFDSFPTCINVLSGMMVVSVTGWILEFILNRYSERGQRFFYEQNNITY